MEWTLIIRLNEYFHDFSEKIKETLSEMKLNNQKRVSILSSLVIYYNSLKKPVDYYILENLSESLFGNSLRRPTFVKFLLKFNFDGDELIQTVVAKDSSHTYKPTPLLFKKFNLDPKEIPKLTETEINDLASVFLDIPLGKHNHSAEKTQFHH